MHATFVFKGNRMSLEKPEVVCWKAQKQKRIKSATGKRRCMKKINKIKKNSKQDGDCKKKKEKNTLSNKP